VPACGKLILKKFVSFILSHLRVCFGPQVCIRNSSFRICGIAPWRSSLKNIILLHMRGIFYASLSWVQLHSNNLHLCFQYIFHKG